VSLEFKTFIVQEASNFHLRRGVYTPNTLHDLTSFFRQKSISHLCGNLALKKTMHNKILKKFTDQQ